MRLPSNLLFLGWWLTRQWWTPAGQLAPVPSISVNPNRMVALGENVSIHCKMEENLDGCIYLTKEKDSEKETVKVKKAEPSETVFLIANARQSDAGIYWCRYCTGELKRCSDFREAAYVNIIDPDLPKPSIEKIPSGQSGPGGNVTIKCQGTQKGLTFALYKSGRQIAFQAAEAGTDTAEFLLKMLSLKDAESYTCQYHHISDPFVWSEPSDSVELGLRAKWEDEEHIEDEVQTRDVFMTIIWTCSAAGLLLGLLLLFAFVLYRRRRKRSPAHEDQPVSMTLESCAGKDPDDVAYAELNHQPLKAKQTASPARVPETCVYAPVVKNRTKEG